MTRITLTALALITAPLLGCDNEPVDLDFNDGPAERAAEDIDEAVDDLAYTLDVEAHELRYQTYDTRDDMVRETREILDGIDRELDEIKRELEQARGEARAELREDWQLLKNERAELSAALERAEDATEDSWDQVRAEVNDGLSAIDSAIRDLKWRLKR